MTTLPPGYPELSSSKSNKLAKIVWRDMIATLKSAVFISSISLNYQLTKFHFIIIEKI